MLNSQEQFAGSQPVEKHDLRVQLFGKKENWLIFARVLLSRAISSAGSEHLPYKQRVGGSNPSSPTN